MKKKLLILIGIFAFFQFGLSLSCARILHYYEEKDGKIIYVGEDQLVINKADIKTFQDLDGFFGADNNYIYYKGKKVNNIDVKTFEIVSWNELKPDPIWGTGCQTSYITEFKDKNGTYKLEDIQNGKLKLEK